jgi:hypothetical protein
MTAPLFEEEFAKCGGDSRRDGAVAIYDDTDTTDNMMIVEPIVTTFTPTRDGRCDCCGGKAPASLPNKKKGPRG